MSATEEEVNPYELLGLAIEASEQEIRTAYRQRSLKVHPDRVRIYLCLSFQHVHGLNTLSNKVLPVKNRGNPDAGTLHARHRILRVC